jgi:hypothetical protein
MLANTVSPTVLLSSRLLSVEDSTTLSIELAQCPQLTASEIIGLHLSARNHVEALLRSEFLDERQLRELAYDFAEHTLHIYEAHAPRNRHPHQCVEAAWQYLAGASIEGLQAAIKEAIPVVWQFQGTAFVGAFEAGLATTLLDNPDAEELARIVALHTKREYEHL